MERISLASSHFWITWWVRMLIHFLVQIRFIWFQKPYARKTIEGFKRHSLRIALVEALSGAKQLSTLVLLGWMSRWVQANFVRSIGDQRDSDQASLRGHIDDPRLHHSCIYDTLNVIVSFQTVPPSRTSGPEAIVTQKNLNANYKSNQNSNSKYHNGSHNN